jgi:hypothetical protein
MASPDITAFGTTNHAKTGFSGDLTLRELSHLPFRRSGPTMVIRGCLPYFGLELSVVSPDIPNADALYERSAVMKASRRGESRQSRVGRRSAVVKASRRGESKQSRVRRFQQELDEMRALLLDLKASPGTPQTIKNDVDDAVEELERIRGALPDLVESPDFLDMVSGALKKAYSIGRSIHSK